MARIPISLRSHFFDDPFFSNVWDDFESMRKELWQEQEDFFNRFAEQRRALETESTTIKKLAVENKNQNVAATSDSGAQSQIVPSSGFQSPWWMIPRDLEFRDFFGDSRFLMGFPQLKDQVISMKNDDKKFEVSFDTHGYKPDEITVKVANSVITVEGKHEAKEESGNNKSFSSRHFMKSYSLPKECKMEAVTSNLSSDGVLIVSAPKTEAVSAQPRQVPIEMKK